MTGPSPTDDEDPTAKSLWPSSINCFDLTLSRVVENLALDEALLTAVERDPTFASLRFWQSKSYAVVLGRSNQVETEVNSTECRALGIPILRRTSGGGTVLIGPGCLCYSLVLPLNPLHQQFGISKVTSRLMSRTATGLRTVLPGVEVCGTSDLVQNGLKFSGNAQRWLRQSFIHHGTLLYDFDLSLIEQCLVHPSREPAYRQSRCHGDFVGNIPLTSDALRGCLGSTWDAVSVECPSPILLEASQIAATRYESSEWQISPRP